MTTPWSNCRGGRPELRQITSCRVGQLRHRPIVEDLDITLGGLREPSVRSRHCRGAELLADVLVSKYADHLPCTGSRSSRRARVSRSIVAACNAGSGDVRHCERRGRRRCAPTRDGGHQAPRGRHADLGARAREQKDQARSPTRGHARDDRHSGSTQLASCPHLQWLNFRSASRTIPIFLFEGI
jgi:hypothetical protein